MTQDRPETCRVTRRPPKTRKECREGERGMRMVQAGFHPGTLAADGRTGVLVPSIVGRWQHQTDKLPEAAELQDAELD